MGRDLCKQELIAFCFALGAITSAGIVEAGLLPLFAMGKRQECRFYFKKTPHTKLHPVRSLRTTDAGKV